MDFQKHLSLAYQLGRRDSPTHASREDFLRLMTTATGVQYDAQLSSPSMESTTLYSVYLTGIIHKGTGK